MLQSSRIASSRHAGFTLVELSIVLVIVGLLVGGVMAGTALIRAMEVRQTIEQIEEFKSAYTWFKNKYGCIPGDCENTTDYFTEYMENGDGDGQIQCGDACGSAISENWYAMRSLRLAGFFSGFHEDSEDAVAVPLAPCGMSVDYMDPQSGWMALYGLQGNNYLWIVERLEADPWTRNCLSPNDAGNIDRKMDDGNPATGKYVSLMHRNNSGPYTDCASEPADEGAKYDAVYAKGDQIACASFIPLD